MMNNGNMIGRGAAGMMIPGPQMGMQGMPNPMAANPQMQQLMPQDNMKQVLQAILRKLQQEVPKPGWWRGVNTSERVQNTQRVFALVHQFLGQDVNSALLVAQAFESASFNGSPDKPHYDLAIRNKMQEIQMQGQSRAMVSNMGQPMPGNLNMMMANQQMAANNQGFNPNMAIANMQAAMMHNNPMVSQPQPGQFPNGNIPNNMVQGAMQAQTRPNGAPMLTPQEQQAINQKAEIMYASMTPTDKENAKQKIPQHELIALQSRGEDPALNVCRKLATIHFLKAKQNSMGQQPTVPGAQFGAPGGMGVMNNGQVHGFPNATNGGPMTARTQALQQGFNGNDFFINQQARAIRDQQDGQTVVPASQQGLSQPGIGMQQTGLNAMQLQQQQQQMRQRQQALNNQQLLQNRSAQPGMQAQNLPNQGLRMGQVASQASPAMGRNMMPGGMNQTPRPGTSTPQLRGPQQPIVGGPGPQQPPNLSLNQAQSQSQVQNQVQASMTPQQSKKPQLTPGPTLNNGVPGMTLEGIQTQLARLPPAERAKAVAHYRSLQQQSQLARNGPPSVSAPGPNQPMGIAVSGRPQPPTTLPTTQSTTVGQPSIHETGLRPNLSTVRSMTPDERAIMDQNPFPQQVFQIPVLKQQTLPENVKTWGQLKNWIRQQPISPETMALVMSIQEKQFAFFKVRQQQLQGQHPHAGQPGQHPRIQEQKQPPQSHPETLPARQSLTQSQFPPQQSQPEAQQQRPLQGTAVAMKDKPAAQMAPMAPSKPINAQENMLRFLLNLPDDLTPEACAQLKAKIVPLRQKSDEEIRAFVTMQKKKARHFQELQQRNMQSLQNGQPQPSLNDQMSRQPSMQPQQQPRMALHQQSVPGDKHTINSLPPNQSSVPGGKHPISNLPLNQASTLVKQEQSATESPASQRTIPEQAPKPSLTQPQTNEARMRAVQQIARESQNAYRAGPVQSMNVEGKEKMQKLLTGIQPFMPTKLLHALFFYFTHIDAGNERMMRQFFMSHTAMANQFQDEKCTTLKETFTISLESAEKAVHALKVLYSKIKAFEGHNKAAPTNTLQGQKPQTAPPGPQPLQPGKPTDIKHKIKVEQPPAAPTSETPPNSFHQGLSPPNRPPDGVPTYAPTSLNEGIPYQLTLPESKKRKLGANNQQPVKTQSPSQAPKIVPAPIVKPESSFRCTHFRCEHQTKPFPTGELLARHIEEAHKEKEPEDGLQFALEMARKALNLDANGDSIKVPAMEKSASAQTMKKSISSQSQTLKVEGGVSMSRGTTQTSNLGIPRTPQSIGKSWDKAGSGKAETIKDPLTPDSWADCPVTPVELHRLFPLLEAVQGTMDMASLTPASTLASGKSERNTPNSDAVDNVAMVNEDMGNLIPLSFSNDILGFGQDASLMDDDVLGINWEEAFPSPKRRKTDINGGFDASLFSLHLTNEVDFF